MMASFTVYCMVIARNVKVNRRSIVIARCCQWWVVETEKMGVEPKCRLLEVESRSIEAEGVVVRARDLRL